MTWFSTSNAACCATAYRVSCSERAPVAHLRKLRDANDPAGHSAQLWRGFGEQGYSGALVPEALGGLGLGVIEAGLIAEQMVTR